MGNHFKTRIDGIDVHFVRAKPDPKVAKGKKVLPLLFVHGWPGASTALRTKNCSCTLKGSLEHVTPFGTLFCP